MYSNFLTLAPNKMACFDADYDNKATACWNKLMTRPRLNTASTILISIALAACSAGNQRGIADKRSDFKRFLPMEKPASEYGLRQVRPFFKRANRAEILHIIEESCTGAAKAGSSAFNPATQAGYYVNCTPGNHQLLNGYVPINARRRPHS